MRKGFFQYLLTIIVFSINLSCFSAELKSIKFFQENEVSKIVLKFDSDDVKIKKFHVRPDKQIIIDMTNVSVSDEKVIRPFDTSEFSGSVIFVSTYKKRKSPT